MFPKIKKYSKFLLRVRQGRYYVVVSVHFVYICESTNSTSPEIIAKL